MLRIFTILRDKMIWLAMQLIINVVGVELKWNDKQRYFTPQNASNGRVFCRILHNEMTQTILCLISNNIAATIVSPRNCIGIAPLFQ